MTAVPAEPARVLVVDDAPTVRMYHSRPLAEAGFSVSEAANGLEAVEAALITPFDLFIIDVNMPTMDGYACVDVLRGDTVGCTAPIVIISTENRPGDADRAYAVGANLYMVKPVAAKRLAQVAVMLTTGPAAGDERRQ